MPELQLNVTFPNIPPANLGEFKRLIAEGVAVAEGEEGTLRYDFFLSEDGTKCVLREIYSSSDAVLGHMANMGELLGRIAEVSGGMEIEVFGEPTAQLLEAGAAFEPTVYSHLAGK